MSDLIVMAKELFKSQPMMLECTPPLIICGDIHGQFSDLIRIFNMMGWPPKVNYLFLGDYVDRGRWSLETILLLFALKLKFPENFLLLRGNHETPIVNRIYGFYEDLIRRFGTPRLYNTFQVKVTILGSGLSFAFEERLSRRDKRDHANFCRRESRDWLSLLERIWEPQAAQTVLGSSSGSGEDKQNRTATEMILIYQNRRWCAYMAKFFHTKKG
ncbi:unnamed protein product [Haemonchus placei]|uniref:Serine/threonine-protein phosphatase n=1 Tax=Haemonchus placei TaxID=6290 RepID=A0A0N4XAP7_HAEPC|nr:unnamed protein product [Haemonchus placei]